MRFAALAVCFLAACAPARPAATASAAPGLALVRVNVVDVEHGRILPDQTVLVAGSRIGAVGPSAQVRVPAGARVVDGRGRYLIPGLWDMHAHVHTFWDRAAPLYVANGVTGVRDMATRVPLDVVAERRGAVLSGSVVGPRLVAAGRLLDDAQQWPVTTFRVRNAEEGRRAVDSLSRVGMDFLKVYGSLSREAFFAIAERARERRIPFGGHTPVSVTLLEASGTGMRSIEHLVGVPEECSGGAEPLRVIQRSEADARRRDEQPRSTPGRDSAVLRMLREHDSARCARVGAQLASNGTWITPTLVQYLPVLLPGEDSVRIARRRYVPPKVTEDWRARLGEQSDPRWIGAQLGRHRSALVRTMHGAGVGILAGTDAFDNFIDNVAGYSLHDELRLLVQAGLSPLDALCAATSNPARYLEAIDSLGTVETGKLADLVLLSADPLEDIRNTQRIEAVVLNGRYLDRSALDALLAEARRAAIAGEARSESPPSPLALVLRQMDAFNAHDADAFAAFYAEDAEQRVLGARDTVEVRGREGFRERTATLFQRAPGLRVEVLSQMVTGPFVVLHERASGIPDGRAYDAVYTYEVRGGRIVRVWRTERVPVGGTAGGGGSGTPPSDDPVEAWDSMTAAWGRGDTVTLGGLIADDYRGTPFNGRLSTRASLLRHVAQNATGATGRYRNRTVRRLGAAGDVAVITATQTDSTPIVGPDGARRLDIMTTRVTDVLERRGGRWQLVSMQETLVPPDAAARAPGDPLPAAGVGDLGAAAGLGSPSDPAAGVKAARDRWNAALAARDTAALRAILGDSVAQSAQHFSRKGADLYVRGTGRLLAARPDLSLIYEPERIEVSRAFARGALAWEFGHWRETWSVPDGPTEIRGTYYAVWREQEGRWRLAAETFVPTSCTGEYCSR